MEHRRLPGGPPQQSPDHLSGTMPVQPSSRPGLRRVCSISEGRPPSRRRCLRGARPPRAGMIAKCFRRGESHPVRLPIKAGQRGRTMPQRDGHDRQPAKHLHQRGSLLPSNASPETESSTCALRLIRPRKEAHPAWRRGGSVVHLASKLGMSLVAKGNGLHHPIVSRTPAGATAIRPRQVVLEGCGLITQDTRAERGNGPGRISGPARSLPRHKARNQERIAPQQGQAILISRPS